MSDLDFTLSNYCHRFGRLPPRWVEVAAVVVMVVLWPLRGRA